MTNKDPRYNNLWFDTSSLDKYFQDYKAAVQRGLDAVDRTELNKFYELMSEVSANKKMFYTCGNGGSAAIANHLVCDWSKGTFIPGKSVLRSVSLSSNVPFLTAAANDFGLENAFSKQLEILAQSGDALVAISSSGNSPNILACIEQAKKMGLKTVALTGFTGGKAKELADISIYIPIHNYAVVEDCHQAVMQVVAQYFVQQRE